MKRPVLIALCALLTPLASAADLRVEIELPDIKASDYRRPYIAVWLERPDNSVAANLAVWYDVRMRNDEGTTWLKDIRQWWRRIGRDTAVPVDGVTSATRGPGTHKLSFTDGAAPLGKLAKGEYRLMVEASREHGGREVISVPLQWPPAASKQVAASGEREIGRVAVELIP
jgi:hypothetical protein